MPGMRFLWPKSLSGLMLLGVAIIAVPLLIAISNAALQIRQLADSSRIVASEGVGAARASEDLTSEILLLERATRLYLVLADPKQPDTYRESLLDAYREHDGKLTSTRLQLARQLHSAAASQTLAELGALQKLIGTEVSAATANSGAVRATLPQIAQMSTLAQRIAVQSKVQVDAQIAAIQRRTDESQRLLLWQSGLLVPLAIFAIAILTFGVGRPLRQVDRAISELGRGNLSHPISVSGPRDIERLGRQLEWLR